MSLFRNKILLLSLIIGLGLIVRLAPNLDLKIKSRIILETPDSYYHARRALVTADRFPRLPQFDYYISYPTGGYCIWPPLYDFFSAAIAYCLFLGSPTDTQVEWVCALYSIIYGLLIIYITFLIGKKLFNAVHGYLAALLVAVLPGAVMWSRLGYFDHHIAEALSIVLIFYLLIRKEEKNYRDYAALGIVFGISMLLWQGSIFFVGVAFILLLLSKAFRSILSFIIGFLMILPFSVDTHYPDSPFSYRGLSLLHLTLLLIPILVMAIGLLKKKSLWLAALPFAALIALSIMLIKERLVVGGIFFLTKKDPWLATIMEFQPLIVQKGYWETLSANILFGRAYFLWPVMVLLMALEKKGRRDFFVFLVLTGIMSFVGRRYSPWFTPFYALLLAYFFVRVHGLFPRKLINWAIIAVLVFVIFQPISLKAYRYVSKFPTAEEVRALNWLRDSTAATSFYLEPARKPEYGVMCFWDDGHYIAYIARRPVAASNFGNDVPNFREVNEFFLTTEEDTANKIMTGFNCQYLFLPSNIQLVYLAAKYLGLNPRDYLSLHYIKDERGLVGTIMEPKPRGVATITFRLYQHLGSGCYYENNFLPALHRFRLKYFSPDIKIFQYVRGASIKGKTAPFVPVKIYHQDIFPNCRFDYFDSLTADSTGTFITTVPYPADSANLYRFEIGNRVRNVAVPESSVLNGDTIVVSPE